MSRTPFLAVLAGTLMSLAAGGAAAQYDKDGRYVPSPGGVPTDPYARPIPNYPGNPGGAIGTPIWPRGPELPAPPKVLQQPRTSPGIIYSTPVVPLSVEQCDQGWAKSTHLTPVEFRRRCTLLKRKRARQQADE